MHDPDPREVRRLLAEWRSAMFLHDVRNMLGCALAWLDEEALDAPPEKRLVKARECLDSAYALSTEGMRQLLEDEPSASPSVVERVARMAQPRLEAGFRVRTVLPDGLPRVRITRLALERITLNLILNASAAAEGGGTLWIEGRAESRWVVLRFRDDGPGMDPSLVARVFDNSVSTKSTGDAPRGLGLPAARGLARAFGGRLELDHTGSEGTQISLFLETAP